jgi:cupin fold WbuC family metalloprotein
MLPRMKIFGRTLLDELATKATASPRKRAHHTIHEAASDRVQRFFVTADPDTYFRPHRHHTKSELAVVVRGRFELVTFDDDGRITARFEMGDETPALAYETPRATWHTLLSLTPGATFLEVKEGPYDASTAAEFAAWAPAEGDASVPQLLQWLRGAKVGERF